MPRDPKQGRTPERRPSEKGGGGAPRDASQKTPYYEGYFGTEEEEGVEREHELDEGREPARREDERRSR